MQSEANGAVYSMASKKRDFESEGVRHEGKCKLALQMRNAHTRARE